jgi:hypothetical protein
LLAFGYEIVSNIRAKKEWAPELPEPVAFAEAEKIS